MRVALVTWEELPDLSDDDRALVAQLEELGVTADPAVWSDPSVDWSEFDLAVIRSTWDYHLRLREFLDWSRRASGATRLWNPVEIVRWNSHKSYLGDLDRKGVPVVPTRYCAGVDEARAALRRERWTPAVVKPAVSGGGYRTFRVEGVTADGSAGAWRELDDAGELLVQPYLGEVERSGERSLVFLGGEYSHAFLRAPRLARSSTLVEGVPVRPTGFEISTARRAIAAAPASILYGRVDLVPEADDRCRVMELELIEPYLGLRSAEGAARSLADRIVDEASLPPSRGPSGSGRKRPAR